MDCRYGVPSEETPVGEDSAVKKKEDCQPIYLAAYLHLLKATHKKEN